MKNLLFLLFWLGIGLSSAYSINDIVVYGQVRGAKGGTISLHLLHDFINFNEITLHTEMDSVGNFTLNVTLVKPCLAELHCNNEKVRLYLQPNDNISVVSDYADFARNIIFLGKGADENNYLTRVATFLEPAAEMKLVPSKVRDLSPSDYAIAVALKKNLQWTFFRQYIMQRTVSPDFERLIRYEIDYTAAYELLVYPEMHAYFSGSEKMTLPENYYAFLETTPLEDSNALITYCYANFLEEYVRYLFREHPTNTTGGTFKYAYLAMYDLAKAKFENKQVRDFVLAQNLVNALENSELSLVEPQYEDYKNSKPYPQYVALLELNYKKYKTLSKGHEAPFFKLKDTSGKPVALNDFIGKVVYIDFWASWCKPCLKEVQFANELKQKMAGKDIVFIYISLDENEQHWRNSIKNRNIQGVHLNSKGISSEVAINYNIQNVPSYFLIDKQGKMVDAQAKRPSDKTLQNEMEMLLQR